MIERAELFNLEAARPTWSQGFRSMLDNEISATLRLISTTICEGQNKVTDGNAGGFFF
jgi:hypothetical protein